MEALSLTQNWLPDRGRFRPARRRAWAVLLTLALALAAFMHVAHTHDADAPATYKFCTFCTTLDRGSAPPPVVAFAVPRMTAAAAPSPRFVAAPAVSPSRTPHSPRAPPALQA
jgi:hypothetical protein